MSRTYRLKDYKNGKPVFTRHVNQHALYHWGRHERPEIRRSINKSRRLETKQHFKKFGYIEKYFNTQGWESW